MKTKISKLFLAILAVVMLPPALANAQEKEGFRLIQPEIVEFNPYWYMQLQAGGGYTVGETNDFFKLTTPAAAINFGYRAVPWFGFRFGASGWQGKGYMVSPELNYKWNYVQGNIDAIVSLTNAFCGFNPDRVIDAYIGVGIGGAYGWHNKQAIDYNDKYGEMQKLWKKRRAFLAGRGILGIDFNTSSVFAINVELNANMMPDSWNSKRGANVDWQFNGLVGFTLKFGSNKKVTPAVYEEIVEETVVVTEPAPQPAPEPAPAPVKKVEPMKQDIFFLINSHKIRQEEMAKVNQLIDFMKKNDNCKVTITGYADKETGTDSYNMALSKKRSQSVADALIAAGIDPSRIVVDADGDNVQAFPASEYKKNRVAICITKE